MSLKKMIVHNEEELVRQENRLDGLIRHIKNVQDDCTLLGQRLIDRGETELGRMLIANGMIHDNSKFHGIEWLYLHDDIKEEDPILFKQALTHHATTNKHHPECWPGGINEMPQLYIAEMICDWRTRSSEFGTDLWDWIKNKATEKFGFSTNGKAYKEIKFFTDLLLEKKFR